MLKDRDFWGKNPNLHQMRGSIGQVAEVWSKIKISMETPPKVLQRGGSSAKSAKGINNSRVVVKVTGLR